MHATAGVIAVKPQVASCYDSLLLPTCVLVLHIADYCSAPMDLQLPPVSAVFQTSSQMHYDPLQAGSCNPSVENHVH